MTTDYSPGERPSVQILERLWTIESAVVRAFDERERPTVGELVDAVDADVGATFPGSVPLYVATVVVDLESRGAVERRPGDPPQRLRFVGSTDDEE